MVKIDINLTTFLCLEAIECFHSRDQHLCKFIGTKESVCIRKEFNSHRIGLGHQHGRRFIVLGHQYGRRDVMWKHSIKSKRKKRGKLGHLVQIGVNVHLSLSIFALFRSFRRLVSPMGYNYFAYEVLHGVQVMQPNYTVPVSIQRKRDRN